MKSYCFIVFTAAIITTATSEFVTLSLIGSAVVAGGWYKWDTLKDNTVCRVTECCNDVHVPYDMDSKCLILIRIN